MAEPNRWLHIRFRDYPAPRYEFFEPELSADRRVATLPVGGEWTTGTRAEFENEGSRLLWERFPLDLQLELEEGITEPDFVDGARTTTNWRKALRPAV